MVNRTRQTWAWAVATAAVSGGLGIFVNLATTLKTSFLAWVGVVALVAISAVVSVLGQRQVQRRRQAYAPSRGVINVRDINTVRHNEVNFHPENFQGEVRIYQTGRNFFIFEIIVSLILSLLVYFTVKNSGDPDASRSGESPAAQAEARVESNGPLKIGFDWPLTRGCDGGTQVAMSNSGPKPSAFSYDGDERKKMVTVGGGVWIRGFLYLHLSTDVGQQVQIDNIRPVIDRSRLAPPAWIYSPEGGCGGPGDRIFELDLDKPSFKDIGVRPGIDGEDLSSIRTEPIGPSFIVSNGKRADLRIDARSCRDNYKWKIELTYSVDGESGEKTATVGPFISMGYARNTDLYTVRGADHRAVKIGVVNGNDSPDSSICKIDGVF